MRIVEIISQHRRDFKASYECEHCQARVTGSGYDDDNFHNNVIPQMACGKCKKTSSLTYRPLTTKYPEGTQL
jgi:hypothetical protein